ncbi:MAG: GatB/YqeY domain-containing protein [Woeseiaceae bacterium]
MSLKGKILNDVKDAMKAGEKDRLKVLRLITAAIKQVEVDERIELDDAAVLGILNKMVKQRRDSITQFKQGNRQDLADIEQAEIEIVADYLPEQLSDTELDAIIEEAISSTGAENIRDMGKVMGVVKGKAQGRADMGAVGGKVKARLSQ